MHPNSHLKVARVWAKLLDKQFSIFGFKFGLDPLIGAIPIIGDWIGVILALYIVWIAIKMELPFEGILHMLLHIFLDFFLGMIPVFGIFADFFYGANTKNLAILEKHASGIIFGEVLE